MAVQDLRVWCQDLYLDPVTMTTQRRDLSPEESMNGWLRNATISNQQMNQLHYLETIHAKASPFSPDMIPDTKPAPSVAYDWVDGAAISETESPELYAYYGATFPVLQANAPSGWKYIIRKF